MPIGVPRIIYCWGEELPAQWTDIYNFIFRRRMVFLMQYLDDELCNQICGLLINIHMEDRSKELEKKEIERSGLFKNQSSTTKTKAGSAINNDSLKTNNFSSVGANEGFKKTRSAEDLLTSDEDLGIDENNTLEQYTLQKITMEWLNWNAQFFDYSSEPYLFYLAELFSKDFSKNDGQLLYHDDPKEMYRCLSMFKNMLSPSTPLTQNLLSQTGGTEVLKKWNNNSGAGNSTNGLGRFDVYSPFRLLANFASEDYSFKDINPLSGKNNIFTGKNQEMFAQLAKLRSLSSSKQKSDNISSVFSDLAQKDFYEKMQNHQKLEKSSMKALGQRQLRREYKKDQIRNSSLKQEYHATPLNYLSFDSYDLQNRSYSEYKDYYRKQTERSLQEEEAKKVFVIINSFGGSVGNGITVHDALQFIKAGSLTLALGVAASAASLALAGGTIGERYVTEGCHVMIHQPEGGLQGQASDIWIDSQEIMKIRLDVAEIYSLSTYRPRHKILRDLDRDFYLTATETIYYGLADEIATNEVMHEIIEMTSKVWDYHDSKQQRLLESRETASSGLDTQTQN